jgi:uncharacterized protein (DUF433 family)
LRTDIERKRIMATTSTTWEYLAPKSKSAYKQLFIKGRNIAAYTLYCGFMSAEEPMTVEEIAKDYDLPIEAVREAIRYCQTNPPEIQADFDADEALEVASQRAAAEGRRLTPQELAELYRQ